MVEKFIRYFFTAGIAAIVDLSGFWLLFALHVPLTFAAIASWLIAALVNYTLTTLIVFHRPLAWASFVRFLTGASAGFCLNTAITIGLSKYLGTYPPIAKVAGIGSAFVFNFLVNIAWVYR